VHAVCDLVCELDRHVLEAGGLAAGVPRRASLTRTPFGTRHTSGTIISQKFITVTSRPLSAQHGKLIQMPGEARTEETAAEAYPIIVRSFEPIADLDDRLQRIFTVLSLPPLEELSAQGPCVTRSGDARDQRRG
jgi:hypothetical protein